MREPGETDPFDPRDILVLTIECKGAKLRLVDVVDPEHPVVAYINAVRHLATQAEDELRRRFGDDDTTGRTGDPEGPARLR